MLNRRLRAFLALLLCLPLLAACVARADFDELTRGATAGELLPATRAATLEDEDRPEVVAHVAIRHAPHLADVPGGLPVVIPPSRPIVNRPWTLAFTTRPTAPYPDQPAALFVSFTEPGDAWAIPNGRGGMLQVPPSSLRFKPGQVDWLTQQNGRVRLDITFGEQHAGLRIWCQLVVKDPVAGVLVSPMVAVTVGVER